MIGEFSPGLILIFGALLIPLLPRQWRAAYTLLLPVATFVHLLTLPHGELGQWQLLGLQLTSLRVDRLSLLFGFIFSLAALLGALYALHERDVVQQVAAPIYAGSALGAVFAGDLVTLFIFWEILAVASVFLIWARRTEHAYGAGMRYLVVQILSGVLLLAGTLMHYRETGSLAFDSFGLSSTGTGLIFIAFGIKCAFPLLHNWLQDAYPEATVSGTVYLSSFTTKVAVYALARGYAGFEPLIYVGAVMTLFPVFFAVIENDLRRVLSFSINNQLGFMVCGVGLAGASAAAGALAMNGVAAHAFADVIFKGLLFMSMGAVLHRVGTTKATELGGLYKTMPFTALFCMIGAASISALPLFSAFVTKSLILAAAAEQGRWLVWLLLLFASAGVLEHAGIKIPFFAFFAHDSGKRPAEAPWNMLLAMLFAAFLCIYIGVRPDVLYGFLPFEVDYVPYSLDHVITQSQLVLAATFAFVLLYRYGLYPPERRVTILDFDWLYRRAGAGLVGWLGAVAGVVASQTQAVVAVLARAIDRRLHAVFSPAGALSRATPTGVLAVWTVLLLGVAIVVAHLAPI